jgi:hypothetical protein
MNLLTQFDTSQIVLLANRAMPLRAQRRKLELTLCL